MSETDPRPEEELVDQDDAVIGKAFRWSLVGFLAIGAVVGIVLALTGKDDEPAAQEGPVIEGPSKTVEAEDAPPVQFTDITKEGEIHFSHFNGARGGKYLPETMGSGCAFLDFDGDGDQDLLFVDSAPWPWDADEEGSRITHPELWESNGSGRFTFVETAFKQGNLYAMGAACGDYDADGDVDVLITGVGANWLFRNDEGAFTFVADAGVTGPKDAWNTSAGFCDLDRDGDLDLFVCNYVKWSREIDETQNYTLKGVGRAYGPPTSFEGTHSFLYRNNGDGTFTDVSKDAGIQVSNPATGAPMGKALGVSFADFDGDNDFDIFVANDTVQNFLFENKGGMTFEEVGVLAGVAYDTRGAATGAMGSDVGDVRGDGNLGIAVGNFASEMSSLYVARKGGLQFNDDAISEGIGAPSRKALSFGLFFFDYDLDGRLDLFQTNGHLEEEINKVQPSQYYEQPSQLFWNAGPDARSAYALVDPDSVGDLSRKVVGRGCAYADIDADGDLDIVITQCGRAPLLLRNDQATDHHWLRVVVKPKQGSPIGTRVTLTIGGRSQTRVVMPTRSYLSQVELPVTFGLGKTTKVDSLSIRWPDGQTTTHAVEGVDRVVTVER